MRRQSPIFNLLMTRFFLALQGGKGGAAEEDP